MERVLIVGGGLSGLATAYFLSQYAIPSTIVEKSHRTGGLVKTDFIEGCRLEAGPDSFIATKPAITDLAQELPALKDRIIGSNDAARRIFIVKNNRLLPMPKGMVMMVPAEPEPLQQSELLSDGAKQRVEQELYMRPMERPADISVGQLVEEHFGNEVLEYLTEPLLCGVYGGESENLSAESVLPRFMGYERQYGSLVKGAREELRAKPRQGSLFLSLRDGMQSLTDALAAGDVQRGEVTNITRNGHQWDVRVDGQTLAARHVVLAAPAHINANLLENSAPNLAAELAAIPYSSAMLLMLVYDQTAVGQPLDGFGFLVPRGERKTVAAVTSVNTKFPSRIKSGLVALRAFIVGKRAAELATTPPAEILELVRADYQRLMGISAAPLFHTFHAWPNSMPQYVVGHARRAANIQTMADECPGLWLVGNAYDGVGLPDCVRLARAAAQRICQASV